jgi:predicted peptidase
MTWNLPSLTFLLGTCFLLSSTFAQAADVRERFEKRSYVDETGATLPYRLLKPSHAADGKKYPLVIFLHGAGERGTDNVKQLVHGMADFASDEIMKKYPAFVVAPQCPEERQWVEVAWSADEHTQPKEPSVPLRQTFELIDQLAKELPIDIDRIYITGLSMGGFGTWDAIHRKPALFAAAVPVCGGGDPAGAEHMKSVPVWAFHGDADGAVKVRRSRDMIAALEAVGGTPKYTEYPGVGHDSWTATYRDPDLYAWLFAQSRTP